MRYPICVFKFKKPAKTFQELSNRNRIPWFIVAFLIVLIVVLLWSKL